MKRNTRYLIFMLFILSFALVLTNCGSSSGGGGGNKCGGGDCAEPSFSVAGFWSVKETAKDSNCLDNTLYDYSLEVTQDGKSITISDGVNSWKGQMCGSKVYASGSYYDDNTEGTVTISCMTLKASSSCSFTGTSKWTWSDGSSSCSGTTQLEGVNNVCM
jgi:hypothetical protein